MKNDGALQVIALIAMLSSTMACANAPGATRNTPARVQPEYDQRGRLQKIEYDRNGDGKPDTWGYMDGARVVRVEADENGDGKVDSWEYHTATAAGTPATPQAGPDTTVERVERATAFDGRISRWEYFASGALLRVEEDTDGNGTVDKWETYTDGALNMMALDTQGRGTPDRRLVYGPDGDLDHLEADPTGSGTFERVNP